ncbi:unnamed protein product [Ixodes pacificus]
MVGGVSSSAKFSPFLVDFARPSRRVWFFGRVGSKSTRIIRRRRRHFDADSKGEGGGRRRGPALLPKQAVPQDAALRPLPATPQGPGSLLQSVQVLLPPPLRT